MRLRIWCGPLRRTLSIASRTYSVVNRKSSLHPESFRLTMHQKTSPVCTCRQIWRLVLKICQRQEIVLTIALRQYFYGQKDRHPCQSFCLYMLNVKKTEYASYAPRNNVNARCGYSTTIFRVLPATVTSTPEKPLMLLNSFQTSARV